MFLFRAVCLKLLWRKFSSGCGCGCYLIWGIGNVCDCDCIIANRWLNCISMFLFTPVRSKCAVAVADADAWCKVALRERSKQNKIPEITNQHKLKSVF